MCDNKKDKEILEEEDFDLRLEMDEFMEEFRKNFGENMDPRGEFKKFALMYLNAAGFEEEDIDGVHYLLNRSLDVEEECLEELEHIDKSDTERIAFLKDRVEKCQAISVGLMTIVLNYTEDADFEA